jgi:hypothetical protein
MSRIIIILLFIGCSYRYDTSIANENNLLKSLLIVNNNTYINKVTNTTTTNTGSGNTTTTGVTTTTTVGSDGVTTTTVSPPTQPLITIRNFYLAAYDLAASSFYSYYQAEQICFLRGMTIVNMAQIAEYAKIMKRVQSNRSSATTTELNMWYQIQNGYYRYWLSDVDGWLADDSVAYYADTKDIYTLRIVYGSGANSFIYNKSNKWMSVLCFKQ